MVAQERLVHSLGAVALGAWTWLSFVSWRSEPVTLATLFVAVGIGWATLLGAWRAARRVDPAGLLRAVWVWAVLFRLAGALAQPVREDDNHRYLWDGWVFAERGDPYGVAPAQWFGDASAPEKLQRALDQINYPETPTIYGPVLEWAFLMANRIAPGELWPWKAIVTAADLGTLALVQAMAGPAGALLYGWCPLVVQESAFNAHPEPAGVFALMAAIWLARRERFRAAAAAVVIAAGVKLTGALAAPWILRRADWRAWLAAGVAAAALWGPFVRGGVPGELAGLAAFAGSWEFNSTGFAILKSAVGRDAASVLSGFLLASLCLAMWRRDGPVRGDILYGALFALAPVANPWYLLWMAPFVAMRPSAAGLAALGAVTLSYAHGPELVADLGAYEHPIWVRPLECAIVAGAAVAQWRPARRVRALAEAH